MACASLIFILGKGYYEYAMCMRQRHGINRRMLGPCPVLCFKIIKVNTCIRNFVSEMFLYVCLFVCLGFIIPLENFSLIWRRHHYRWRAANFDLCSTLMAIEQWGFFSVSHLLWHGSSVYNGHLRGPVTLTPIAERLAVELSRPVFTT